MLKKILLLACAATCAATAPVVTASAAKATELKLGFVDLKAGIENTKRYQRGFARLQKLKDQKKAELDALRKQIDQAESDIMGQSMAMSPERLSKKQNELKELRKAFTRKQQDAQEELMTKKNNLDAEVLTSFYEVVRDYGKQEKYDFILQKSSVFYADPRFDITPKITDLLDKKK